MTLSGQTYYFDDVKQDFQASKDTELGSRCIPVVRCIHTALAAAGVLAVLPSSKAITVEL